MDCVYRWGAGDDDDGGVYGFVLYLNWGHRALNQVANLLSFLLLKLKHLLCFSLAETIRSLKF